ncbi:hypothetical protein DSL72_008138 [Monilinia vaccinii-corymbosi]|uniref:Uncharacterized protein n=1 Tax=Monilinia vaccinii-corymbosi TaxID=61207 RepID=A0A8A3PJU6_9HELO|nr:hypothetical protein DSL72_008138 [Monilinia vaccinii-corymbosi]
MGFSTAHLARSSSSKMKASNSSPGGESLKRTAEFMDDAEEQPIKRVKPTKPDRNQIAPPKSRPVRNRKNVAPKSIQLLFTSDRVNTTSDTTPLGNTAAARIIDLEVKLKSKAAKGKMYKQRLRDIEARFDDLSRKHYTLGLDHSVEENLQIAERNLKTFRHAYEMVKDKEIQQVSYIIFEGRKTPCFISQNYSGPNITAEELAIQKAADDEEVAEVEDFLNGITREFDNPVESIEEVPEHLQLTDEEIENLMEEHAEKLRKERGSSDPLELIGSIVCLTLTPRVVLLLLLLIKKIQPVQDQMEEQRKEANDNK